MTLKHKLKGRYKEIHFEKLLETEYEAPWTPHLSWTYILSSISIMKIIQEIGTSVQFSCLVVSDSLRPHESQHAKPPCPSPTPRVYPNPCPSSQWCHPAISSSVVPFSSCPQSLPASESFPMSQLFAWGSQNIGVSALASVLPKNTQDWSPLEWTVWISLQSKGLSRVFSNTTVQKHQFFGTQLSSYLIDKTKWICKLQNVIYTWLQICQYVPACMLSHVWPFAIPWTVAFHAPLSDSPGKNTGVGCHFFLQGIFLIQASNLCLPNLLHWQVDSLPMSHLRSPKYVNTINICLIIKINQYGFWWLLKLNSR